MAGIGVIYNPRSGRNRRDPTAARRLGRALGDHGVLREASSLDELYRVAEDFRGLGIDVLGISGGDGTNGVTLTGFLEVYAGCALPPVAFLRGGTMNTAANAVGVRRGPPEGLLGQLVRGYVARHATPLTHVERHLLCVHTEQASPRAPSDPGASIPAPPARAGRPSDAGRASHKYGFVFGTGAVCGYLAEYYAGGTPNARVAARTLLRGVGSALVGGPMSRRMAAPFRGSVHLPDGVVWEERDYLAVAAGTIDQIGLNFRPFRRYAEAADHFHVLGIHASAIGFVTELPRIWRAAPMRPEHTFEAVTPRMTLRSPRQPFRYMIDGDLHQCEGALHVAIGPKVRIVVEADRARADAAEGQLRGNAGAVGESIAGAAR